MAEDKDNTKAQSSGAGPEGPEGQPSRQSGQGEQNGQTGPTTGQEQAEQGAGQGVDQGDNPPGQTSGTANAGAGSGAGSSNGQVAGQTGIESGGQGGVDLSDFSSEAQESPMPAQSGVEKEREREAILDVPVKITAVVGDVKMPVRDLVRLGRGAVVPLNRKLGSSIDIYANDRLIARGEITIIEDDNIAVTMTEIMSSSSSS